MKTSPTVRKQKPLYPHVVTRIDHIGGNAYILEVEKRFAMIAGQVVAVSLNNNMQEPRLYSIASGMDEPNLRILFDVNPKGLLTPQMAQLHPGDSIQISEPFGKFLGDSDPAWWIATGTGIAPFVSMMESGLVDNKTLIHGARTLDKFYFHDQFSNALHDRYIRFCTTQTHENVIHGRLTHWLRQQSSLPKDIKYYLCGNADMVVEVREILIEQHGIPFEKVMAEIYF